MPVHTMKARHSLIIATLLLVSLLTLLFSGSALAIGKEKGGTGATDETETETESLMEPEPTPAEEVAPPIIPTFEQDGWNELDEALYYVVDGQTVTGRFSVDGKQYSFAEDGAMQTGLVTLYDEVTVPDTEKSGSEAPDAPEEAEETELVPHLYYFAENGVMQTGWIGLAEYEDDEDSAVIWYYFEDDGIGKTGWLKSGGSWYYIDDGLMQTGFLPLEEADDNGEPVTTTYYLADNGVMQTGWVEFAEGDSSIWYYFLSSGKMATGWEKVGGSWYYLDEDGVMCTGLLYLDETDDNGEIVTNTYLLADSGKMVTGWYEIDDGSWWYFYSSGVRASGWVKVNGYWYYLDPDDNDIMLSHEARTIDGEYYEFATSGRMLTKVSRSNGFVKWPSSGSRICPLTVYASGSEDCYVYFKCTSNSYRSFSVYVKAGSSLDVDVPTGTYKLYYCCGDTWYGSTDKFGLSTSYYVADGTSSFYISGSYAYGHTYTLNTYYGDTDVDSISGSDFPG